MAVDPLDAALAVLNEEFNSGENFSEQSVEPVETSDSGDTLEPKLDDRGRAHGPDGKFVSKEKNEETEEASEEEQEAEDSVSPADEADTDVEEEAPSEEEEDQFLEIDPEHPFFTKYQGDPDKALKALEDSQVLVGRQSQELAELRQIREEIASLKAQQAAGSVDWADAIEEDPKAAADLAVQYGNGQALVAALRSWADEDSIAPMLYLQALQNEHQQNQQMAVESNTLDQEFAALKQRHPDVDKFLPAIEKVVAERPLWRDAISQGEPRARAQAFEDLYLLARGQSESSDTPAAVRKVVLRAKADAERAKEDAAVVTASRTSVVTEEAPNAKLQTVLKEISGLDVEIV